MKKACMMFLAVSFLLVPVMAGAAANVVAIEGMAYNVKASLADNLKALEGKQVYITLKSGTVLAGTVKTVGDHLVHLEKLDRKDFFDALIRLDEIAAIDTKFRDFQR
ncbi:hypothetical protein [Desulfosudis oleivorans]|uniref:BON domain-containing protein n=1 Tax=Desulfosudis oleivorans (strain DSM 6200 / JCM 39069 / Hxd3) TaxID=96561 RepID=A8ZUH2_DESOH|nr:hypothetical protein [Desulfosudis oleivorans]ABW68004.1 conserved hypothetical protein [Desulfosudis oleivorans Hxd3]